MKFMILTFAFFMPLLTYGNCDRGKVNQLWFDIMNGANKGDVTQKIEELERIHPPCKGKFGVRSDINPRNIQKYKRHGFLVEYNRALDVIHNGDSFKPDQVLFWAGKANLNTQQIAEGIRNKEEVAKNKCKPRNYRDKLPPVRDQDSMGWCFAFASADLLSFKLGKTVSATDIALGYHTDGFISSLKARLGYGKLASSLGIGFGKPALESAVKKGICLEKDLPSEDFKFSDRIKSIKETLLFLEQRAGTEKYHASASDDSVDVTMANVLSDDGVNFSGVAKTEIVNMIRENSCQNRVKMNLGFQLISHNKDSLRVDKRSNNFLRNQISEQLLNGNISLLYIDVNVFYDPKSVSENDNHEALVIGQRWNPTEARCDYLVRNTWGTNCNYASDQYQCESDGHIWMPSATLINNTTDIIYAH